MAGNILSSFVSGEYFVSIEHVGQGRLHCTPIETILGLLPLFSLGLPFELAEG